MLAALLVRELGRSKEPRWPVTSCSRTRPCGTGRPPRPKPQQATSSVPESTRLRPRGHNRIARTRPQPAHPAWTAPTSRPRSPWEKNPEDRPRLVRAQLQAADLGLTGLVLAMGDPASKRRPSVDGVDHVDDAPRVTRMSEGTRPVWAGSELLGDDMNQPCPSVAVQDTGNASAYRDPDLRQGT